VHLGQIGVGFVGERFGVGQFYLQVALGGHQLIYGEI